MKWGEGRNNVGEGGGGNGGMGGGRGRFGGLVLNLRDFFKKSENG